MVLSLAASAPMIICVLWPAGAKRGGFAFVAVLTFSFASSTLRREFGEAFFQRHFDVDGKTVGIFAGFGDQRVVGLGDGLEMDVAAEVMLLAQFSRDRNLLL